MSQREPVLPESVETAFYAAAGGDPDLLGNRRRILAWAFQAGLTATRTLLTDKQWQSVLGIFRAAGWHVTSEDLGARYGLPGEVVQQYRVFSLEREEAIDALGIFLDRHPNPWEQDDGDMMRCRYCGGGCASGHPDDTAHWHDCAWMAAKRLVGKEPSSGRGEEAAAGVSGSAEARVATKEGAK